jgi:GMP reductase
MRIEDEIKLTFDDVLIRPKRSTLISRSEVHLERSFKFKHTESIWNGVPIVSANMDTTGTFETAISLQKHKMITAIHKFYTIDDWKKIFQI